MTRRARLVALGAVATALVGGFVLASVDRCGPWTASPPGVVGVARAHGVLKAGVAKAPLTPVFPVTVGGYGPIRSEAKEAALPLGARAMVLEAGGVRFGLVELDVLLVTRPITEAVRKALDFPVWIVAAHTHSSLGGYDRRFVAELAGLGSFRADEEQAVIRSARAALDEAGKSLQPVRLELASGSSSGLSTARSGGAVDERLTRVRFLAPDGSVKAQWLLLAAHPTLVERRVTRLDPDYPGRVALAAEQNGPTTFVLQASGGNASAATQPGESIDAYASRVASSFAALTPTVAGPEVDLAWGTVLLGLPHPDGSRVLASGFGRGIIENALCDGAEREVELSVLRVGPLSLLAAPFEAAQAAGPVLEEQAAVTRVIGPANGYFGYVDLEQAARERWGESPRQYFPPELLRLLADGARLAGSAAGTPP